MEMVEMDTYTELADYYVTTNGDLPEQNDGMDLDEACRLIRMMQTDEVEGEINWRGITLWRRKDTFEDSIPAPILMLSYVMDKSTWARLPMGYVDSAEFSYLVERRLVRSETRHDAIGEWVQS